MYGCKVCKGCKVQRSIHRQVWLQRLQRLQGAETDRQTGMVAKVAGTKTYRQTGMVGKVARYRHRQTGMVAGVAKVARYRDRETDRYGSKG